MALQTFCFLAGKRLAVFAVGAKPPSDKVTETVCSHNMTGPCSTCRVPTTRV